MTDYKIIFSDKKKNLPLLKAEKVLRKRLKIQKKVNGQQLTQNKYFQSQNLKKTNNSNSSIRFNHQKKNSQYSSFCKNNFEIINLQKLNRNIKSLTAHSKRAIVASSRQHTEDSKDSKTVLLFKIQDFEHYCIPPRQNFSQRVHTQNNERQSLRYKENRSSRLDNLREPTGKQRFQRLLSSPHCKAKNQCQVVERISRYSLIYLSAKKQPVRKGQVAQAYEVTRLQTKSYKMQQKSQQNSYLKRQLSKKQKYLSSWPKGPISYLPMIKQKKIHLR